MEIENKEPQETVDPRRSRYTVNIRRDTKMMKTFFKFKNRVEHPRASMNMFMLGVLLIAFPIISKGIAPVGAGISYGMGTLLLALAFFRQYLSVWLMKSNPEVKVNEELTYLFGNSGIRARKEYGDTEEMGYYKSVYCVWEDERHYYLGMNEDDLLILPKANFQEGDYREFRDFILDKSGAKYIWKPVQFMNVCRNKMLQMHTKMTQIHQDAPENKK